MLDYIFLGFTGFCAGIIIAGGAAGLLVGLSILPRYAYITRTARYIRLYENVTLAGIILGNAAFVFRWNLPFGNWYLLVHGLFSGIFLGAWIMALAEIADVVPVFVRRIRLKKGLPLVIVSAALGKTLGSLLYYFYGWGA